MIIQICDDFDLEKIVKSGQCFRCISLGDTYRFLTGAHVLYIKPISNTEYDISCSMDDWKNIWYPYFDLARNYQVVRQAISNDDFLTQAANFGQGIRILKQDAWEMLISFIISQRKNIPAIQKSIDTLSKTFGERIDTPYETIHLFPSPYALYTASDSDLHKCGLGYRVPYIRDAAEKIYCGKIDLNVLSSAEDFVMMDSLMQIKGVGPKVANCIMLFAYAQTSKVPIDTWTKKIIVEKYDGINRFYEYGANAGIMQQYAFYYIQNHKSEVL